MAGPGGCIMTKRRRSRIRVVLAPLVLMIGVGACNLGLNETPEDESSGAEGYTLRFDSNGGAGTIAPRQLSEGEVTTLPTSGFTRAGGTLLRWTDDEGTPFALGASFTMPARDVTMQATWESSDFYPNTRSSRVVRSMMTSGMSRWSWPVHVSTRRMTVMSPSYMANA